MAGVANAHVKNSDVILTMSESWSIAKQVHFLQVEILY